MPKSISIPIIDLASASGKRRLNAIRKTRSALDADAVCSVGKIVSDVGEKGDSALFAYARKFDGVSLTRRTVRIPREEIKSLSRTAPADFKKALRQAADRIIAYHSKQKGVIFSIATQEGRLTQVVRPLSRVGVYVPGGHTLYPSSVLMNVIPAQIAGVAQIAVVTPARGGLDPKIAFALDMLNVREAYRIGGAHAVAALAFGTQSIAAVDKIVGPGNQYVAIAKKMVFGVVDIDMIAGPSEVVVLADESARPDWVALDLLSQAEHGSGSESALCVVESPGFALRVKQCILDEIAASPVRSVFERMKPEGICIFVTKNRSQSIDFINECAPEHLQIMTREYKRDCEGIKNAAAVFCGPYTPVALGDYYIGTNHVLPTGRTARFASPLGVESFMKRMSIAEISRKGLYKCASDVSVLARSENFIHHALSVERRVR